MNFVGVLICMCDFVLEFSCLAAEKIENDESMRNGHLLELKFSFCFYFSLVRSIYFSSMLVICAHIQLVSFNIGETILWHGVISRIQGSWYLILIQISHILKSFPYSIMPL